MTEGLLEVHLGLKVLVDFLGLLVQEALATVLLQLTILH